MKVIQIMPEFDLAGAEIMCENLVYALKKLGQDVIVVSLYSRKTTITYRMEAAGIDIRYLDKKSGLDLSMIGKLRNIFKEEKPDVIHTHRHVKQYAIPAAVLSGVEKRIHTVHNIASKELKKSARILARFFYKFCKTTPVALSGIVKESIVLEYGLKESAIPVVFNGIDLSKCIPKHIYENEGRFTILHIGRFAEAKNHLMLLRAFKLFHEQKPDTRLMLIGDGKKRADIETYIKENELEECVELLGLQSNVYGFLNEADMFTLPSIYEGVPMTLIEAMGTGLPIVATKVGGIPDMLTNDESALLVDVNEESITRAFLRVYEDKALRNKLGRNAKARSCEFSFEMMAKKYVDIYQGDHKW